jgi:crossover junction endodeoxyribonuclease RuvC
MSIIIGIDPALTKSGWGVIKVQGNSFQYIASGTIKTNSELALSDRLLQMHEELSKALDLYKPKEAAIEEIFINMNPTSSLKLGHARGSLMLGLGIYQIPVFEYSTTAIKKAITGVGRAQKQQMQAMIKILLPKSQAKSEDEADALAAAICHANNKRCY